MKEGWSVVGLILGMGNGSFRNSNWTKGVCWGKVYLNRASGDNLLGSLKISRNTVHQRAVGERHDEGGVS